MLSKHQADILAEEIKDFPKSVQKAAANKRKLEKIKKKLYIQIKNNFAKKGDQKELKNLVGRLEHYLKLEDRYLRYVGHLFDRFEKELKVFFDSVEGIRLANPKKRIPDIKRKFSTFTREVSYTLSYMRSMIQREIILVEKAREDSYNPKKFSEYFENFIRNVKQERNLEIEMKRKYEEAMEHFKTDLEQSIHFFKSATRTIGGSTLTVLTAMLIGNMIHPLMAGLNMIITMGFFGISTTIADKNPWGKISKFIGV